MPLSPTIENKIIGLLNTKYKNPELTRKVLLLERYVDKTLKEEAHLLKRLKKEVLQKQKTLKAYYEKMRLEGQGRFQAWKNISILTKKLKEDSRKKHQAIESRTDDLIYRFRILMEKSDPKFREAEKLVAEFTTKGTFDEYQKKYEEPTWDKWALELKKTRNES